MTRQELLERCRSWVGIAEALVPTGQYMSEGPPRAWCPVVHVKDGDGSPYPVVVRLPGGLAGQFRWQEILDARLTDGADLVLEAHRMAGGADPPWAPAQPSTESEPERSGGHN